MGSKGGGGGAQQREPTAQEKELWESQAKNLDSLTKIAEDQYNLSVEDREYYEKVFREGSDTQAKEAIAKLQSQITGKTVDPATIKSVNIDTLLRDTILTAAPEFQEAAANLVSTSQKLTTQYGGDVTGLSTNFAKGLTDLSNNYSAELETIKQATGTIDQAVLSRETGAAKAGISTAYAEARQQLEGHLAQRGIGGSGVEAQLLASTYSQEAMAKAGAGTQARQSALAQSEAIRAQQAQLAGQQLQAGSAGLQGAYQAQLGGVQNVYGVTTSVDLQNYQLQQAAQLQGIAGLTQAAQAGQGIYVGAQNYLSGASQTAGQGASIAGQSAVGVAGVNQQYASAQMQANATSSAGIGQMVGTLGAAYMTGGTSLIGGSDIRLKNNIEFAETKNGINYYTWEWNDEAHASGVPLGETYGVMAQEILDKHPEAVTTHESGYYMVDYSKLGA